MQSNTVEVENRAVNFPNFSVEKKTYKPDSFGIRDGRYIGSDGFVVPSNFEEFYERFPDYVRKWVSKHTDSSAPNEDLEDWAQDLLIHLQHLPPTSKYREVGKKDIVQTFDPVKHYGANQARFRNYMNLCLANKFRTMRSKHMKDALGRPGNVSFDGETKGEEFRSLDEFCHAHSAQLRVAAKASEKQSGDRAFLEEFANFVRREDPKVLQMIEALSVTGTLGDALDWLGITEREFGRMRTRLDQLATCFLSGELVPRQRKPYKKRIAKSKQFQRACFGTTSGQFTGEIGCLSLELSNATVSI
jgi:hypothetical protein